MCKEITVPDNLADRVKRLHKHEDQIKSIICEIESDIGILELKKERLLQAQMKVVRERNQLINKCLDQENK